MSDDTEHRERRTSPLKTFGTWVAIGVSVVGLTAGFSKSYFVTPVVLDDHGKKIEKLERTTESLTAKMQEQRELLLEIRGDIKVMKYRPNQNQN